jgi:DMSO reductase anchor subunit
MVYRDTPRALWATRLTSAKFLLSGLASGAAVFLALAAWFSHRLPDFTSGHLAGWMTAVISALPIVLAAKLRCEAFVHRHLDDQEPNPLQKAALLLRGDLRAPHQLRFNAGMVGGMLLPILWLFRGVGTSSAWDLGLALAVAGLVIAGELLERYLFFTTCVPPRMPGG